MKKFRVILISVVGLSVVAGTVYVIQNNQKGLVSPGFQNMAASSPTATQVVKKGAAPTPTQVVPKKKSYTIALFGDSMIDTMGEKAEPLQAVLQQRYPNTTFALYNYGIGAQNIESGFTRVTLPFVNKTRSYPPITQLNPDIIILGSFSYNLFQPHDPAKHRTLLKQLVTKMKQISPNVYLLAEIAPKRIGFGKGEFGINVEEPIAHQYAQNIIEQLDSVSAVAKETGVPLINAYSLSQVDGKFGEPAYVRPEDGIHPSASGHAFTARITARVIAASL